MNEDIGFFNSRSLPREILGRHGRLTFDLDFGDILALARSVGPSVVIFRRRNQIPAALNPRLFRVIDDCKEELASGAIIMVEDERYRFRRLPILP